MSCNSFPTHADFPPTSNVVEIHSHRHRSTSFRRVKPNVYVLFDLSPGDGPVDALVKSVSVK